jgi:hypothetical protein
VLQDPLALLLLLLLAVQLAAVQVVLLHTSQMELEVAATALFAEVVTACACQHLQHHHHGLLLLEWLQLAGRPRLPACQAGQLRLQQLPEPQVAGPGEQQLQVAQVPLLQQQVQEVPEPLEVL